VKASLDLEVTRRCNLRCDHCFVGWSRGWSGEIPVETALAILREGAGHFPLLHITGGEPFAYAELFTLLEEGVRLGYPGILINTNGSLLTPARVRALEALDAPRGRITLSVSLDGPEPLHDAVRGDGQFKEATAAITALLEAGIGVTVMTVVTPEVLAALTPFVFDLKARFPGLTGVTLFPVGVGPEGSQKPGARLRALTSAELHELALTVALVHKTGFSIGVGAYPILNPLLRALGYPEALLYQCTAGRGRVCVHADLTVSPCHPVKEAVYGTYRPGLLGELAGFEAHGRLTRRDFEGCSDCEHRPSCGHCRAFVAAAGEPLLGNDAICREVLPGVPAMAKRVRLPLVDTGPR
jgi:radical SAM protein with 4Fe4S-binding SPASM domain